MIEAASDIGKVDIFLLQARTALLHGMASNAGDTQTSSGRSCAEAYFILRDEQNSMG